MVSSSSMARLLNSVYLSVLLLDIYCWLRMLRCYISNTRGRNRQQERSLFFLSLLHFSSFDLHCAVLPWMAYTWGSVSFYSSLTRCKLFRSCMYPRDVSKTKVENLTFFFSPFTFSRFGSLDIHCRIDVSIPSVGAPMSRCI